MQENKNKVYAIVIGQCSQSLQSTVKGNYKCISKYRVFDAIWLLKKVKKITSGVYTKANNTLTLHAHTMELFNMRQGRTEADYYYLNMFNSRLRK